mgnify:CR=1 FL=1
MAKKYILALDQGTTSSRAIIFNKKGEIVAKAQNEFTQHYPENGWVEHDPMEILFSQISAILTVLRKEAVDPKEIAAIGITNQRETTVVWEKETGRPIYNAIVWQCRRTAELCEELKRRGLSERIQSTTGLLIDAYFSATKIRWILDHVPGVRERALRGEILFGTVETYLIWKLTGEHVTDFSNASRTMLFNIHAQRWDEELLELFGIPVSILPKVVDSTARAGDLLAVTGVLGGSFPTGHHLSFIPRVREGGVLAASGLATAMMDLSDGLGTDLPRLAAASGLGFRIHAELLPVRPGFTAAQAAGDGEDYELLVTVLSLIHI